MTETEAQWKERAEKAEALLHRQTSLDAAGVSTVEFYEAALSMSAMMREKVEADLEATRSILAEERTRWQIELSRLDLACAAMREVLERATFEALLSIDLETGDWFEERRAAALATDAGRGAEPKHAWSLMTENAMLLRECSKTRATLVSEQQRMVQLETGYIELLDRAGVRAVKAERDAAGLRIALEACLEDLVKYIDSDECPDEESIVARRSSEAALTTDAGKGWISPDLADEIAEQFEFLSQNEEHADKCFTKRCACTIKIATRMLASLGRG